MKVGILGGGQLGRMLATAAHELGLRPLIVEPKPDCPASRVAPTLAVAYDDRAALRALADCDVVTYEFENVPGAAVRHLAGIVAVHPTPDALTSTADRLLEKHLFRSLGMPTPRFAAVDSERGLRHAIELVGLPAVLKTRRFGYDGKGQVRVRTLADAATAWRRLGGQPAILEQLVAFDREISLIAVRGRDGSIRFWPPTENRHVDGILRIARAPVEDLDPAAVEPARRAMTRLLERLDYVGVLTVEFFVCGGAWLANEAACRVHNSGHWTLEGAVTSQFENHLRAVAGWPLGATDAIAPVAMANLVGHLPLPSDVLGVPGAHWHDYGKTPAPGRKLGHVTVRAGSAGEVESRLRALVERLSDPALELALVPSDPHGEGFAPEARGRALGGNVALRRGRGAPRAGEWATR